MERCMENILRYANFPISETVTQEIMSLPMNPYLTDDEINFIAATLCKKSKKPGKKKPGQIGCSL